MRETVMDSTGGAKCQVCKASREIACVGFEPFVVGLICELVLQLCMVCQHTLDTEKNKVHGNHCNMSEYHSSLIFQ